ncbi:nudix hydrolase DR_1184-like [Condylostylus longicornis]|uniref:nudix hydrolase DR_1184-like n=1 Tax=Condylostylus longicornis TaxID=2530218 RepID=UPI00244E2356|nr:nudix hydrolase DR_1184-like [Condylostylus longicornis]
MKAASGASSYPKLTSALLSKISQQIHALPHSVVPLLPTIAQDPIDQSLSEWFPVLPSDVQKILKHHQSTKTIHEATFPDRQTPQEKILSTPSPKMAAVLVPLCHQSGFPSVLFTVRSSFVGTHQNQVSFPGGHLEEDETAQAAAVRETQEELGSGVGKIEILGYCSPIYAITGTLVFPILGFIERDVENFQHLSRCEAEVDQIFCLSIDHLLNPKNRRESTEFRFGTQLLMPSFHGGPEIIWGLTGMILDGVLSQILSRAVSPSSL